MLKLAAGRRFALGCQGDRAALTSMTTTSDSGADVYIDWRVVIGVAAALGILFTVQNYWSPAVTRGSSSLERTFLLQIIIWTTWIACSPFVFAVARRWWRDPRLTPAMVAGQVLAAVGVAIIHASLAGTLRWLAGVSATRTLCSTRSIRSAR